MGCLIVMLRSRIVFVSILVFTGLAGGLAIFKTEANNNIKNDKNVSKSGRPEGGRPIPVLTAIATKSNIDVVQTAVGSVVSPSIVTLRSRVNGQLTRIYFKEGQAVRAGEVLAEIDPRPFAAQLTQIQGQSLRNQALLKNSQLDLERYQTLQSQDSIPAQQVDAQTSLVQQHQGTVKADEGLVDNAKLQLSFTKIISPIDGRIGLRQIDVGNNIVTTDVLAVINAVNPIQVVFTVPEDKVPDLVINLNQAQKNGKKLLVEAWDRANKNKLASGYVLSLDNQIDATSGTIKVKGQFKNDDGLLFPNQFVNVRLITHQLQNAIVVPSSAIQHGSIGTFVYVVNGEENATVSVVPVETGVVNGNSVQVKQGLSDQDIVVISGIDKLREGAKVKVAQNDRNKNGNDKNKRGEASHKKSKETLQRNRADSAGLDSSVVKKSAPQKSADDLVKTDVVAKLDANTSFH
jgi:multidrug efflux system membrane fusion protein